MHQPEGVLGRFVLRLVEALVGIVGLRFRIDLRGGRRVIALGSTVSRCSAAHLAPPFHMSPGSSISPSAPTVSGFRAFAPGVAMPTTELGGCCSCCYCACCGSCWKAGGMGCAGGCDGRSRL